MKTKNIYTEISKLVQSDLEVKKKSDFIVELFQKSTKANLCLKHGTRAKFVLESDE